MGFCLLHALTALLALIRGFNLLKPQHRDLLLALLLIPVAYGLDRRWRWAWLAWIAVKGLILLQVAAVGALVIVPLRNFSACVPLTGAGVTDALQHLAIRATELEEQDRHGIMASVCWYYNSRFTDLPFILNADRQPEFTLPDDFIELLRNETGE